MDQAYLTHLPALFSALLATPGMPVLEIGAGSSTRILRAFCEEAQRFFVSVEASAEWADRCGSYHDPDYSSLARWAMEDLWGVVFVDHAPEQRRLADALLFADRAQFIVIHDWSSADTNGGTFRPADQFPMYSLDTRFFPSTITLSKVGIIPHK